MGALPGMLGLGGGTQGTGVNVPGTPYTPGQQQADYAQAQNDLQAQYDLVKALQGQGGIQNQSNLYNTYGQIAQGQGPNPAQAMLNQATGQNVANQAALMAGQRGAGSNVGLMARQAAQTGGNLQQQAVGQGATMQANQQLAALGAQTGLANQMVGNLMQGTQTGLQGAQSQESLTNQAIQGNAAIQGGLAQQGMQGQQSLIGGLMGGAGKGMKLFGAEGGEVPEYMAEGGRAGRSSFGDFLAGYAGDNPQMAAPVHALGSGLDQKQLSDSFAGAFNKTLSSMPGFTMPEQGDQFNQAPADLGLGGNYSFDGAPATSMPDNSRMGLGGNYQFSKGGDVGNKLKKGGHVPGKPKHPGNDYRNDTVKALLSPGEVVIPNSVMKSSDPVNNAAKFVAHVMAKKKLRGK